MKKNYLLNVTFLCVTVVLMSVGQLVQAGTLQVNLSDTTNSGKPKITDTRKNKPSYLSNGVKVNFINRRLIRSLETPRLCRQK